MSDSSSSRARAAAAALLAPPPRRREHAGDDLRGAGRIARRLPARGDARRDPGLRRLSACARSSSGASSRRGPNAKRPPAFDRADHTAYPVDTWGRLDRLVDSTERRGIELQVTLTGPVPTWATGARSGVISTGPARASSAAGSSAVATRYGDRVEPLVDLERAEPPGLPQAAVLTAAGRPRRRSTAASIARPSGRSTARRAARVTRCCSARRRRSATRTSSRRWASCAARPA